MDWCNVDIHYPLLWAFFHGAFQANSCGKAKDEHFADFSEAQMNQAERELRDFTNADVGWTAWLGMQADAGYTIWGQTHQELTETGQPLDDDQHKLLAYELLDTRY